MKRPMICRQMAFKRTLTLGFSKRGDDVENRKIASALKFDPTKDPAPQVLAKGYGLIADNIIATAEKNKVPVYVDEKLSKQLAALQVGEMIPPELYEVVAEVLVFISYMDQKKGLNRE